MDRSPEAEAVVASAPQPALKAPLSVIRSACVAFDTLVMTGVATLVGAVYGKLLLSTDFLALVHLKLGLLFAVLVVAASCLQGAYTFDDVQSLSEESDRLAASILFGTFALLCLLTASGGVEYSRVAVIMCAIPCFLALLLARTIFTDIISRWARRGYVKLPRLLVVGPSDRVGDYLKKRSSQLSACATVTKAELLLNSHDTRFATQLLAIRHQAQALDIERIVLCLPWAEHPAIVTAIDQLSTLPSAIYVADDTTFGALGGLSLPKPADISGHLLIRRPLSASQTAVKRMFDIAISGTALVLLLPVFALIAGIIKFDSPGPVLFRQRRYGYNRVPFMFFKFRTMTAQSSREEFKQATRDDSRVTRIGRLLRRTSLDELPQLANVLLGDMSLVGPRPHPVELDDQFSPIIRFYVARHKIRPGITGWAQVNGHRGETRSVEHMQERILHDVWYLNNWSFWLDIKVLFKTVLSLSSHRNAF